jgi:hypothetical protein
MPTRALLCGSPRPGCYPPPPAALPWSAAPCVLPGPARPDVGEVCISAGVEVAAMQQVEREEPLVEHQGCGRGWSNAGQGAVGGKVFLGKTMAECETSRATPWTPVPLRCQAHSAASLRLPGRMLAGNGDMARCFEATATELRILTCMRHPHTCRACKREHACGAAFRPPDTFSMLSPSPVRRPVGSMQ